MVVVDANVLLYAVNEDSAHHEPARTWLDGALAGSSGVGLPWIVPTPLSMPDAVDQVAAWFEMPAAVAVEHGATVVSTATSLAFRG